MSNNQKFCGNVHEDIKNIPDQDNNKNETCGQINFEKVSQLGKDNQNLKSNRRVFFPSVNNNTLNDNTHINTNIPINQSTNSLIQGLQTIDLGELDNIFVNLRNKMKQNEFNPNQTERIRLARDLSFIFKNKCEDESTIKNVKLKEIIAKNSGQLNTNNISTNNNTVINPSDSNCTKSNYLANLRLPTNTQENKASNSINHPLNIQPLQNESCKITLNFNIINILAFTNKKRQQVPPFNPEISKKPRTDEKDYLTNIPSFEGPKLFFPSDQNLNNTNNRTPFNPTNPLQRSKNILGNFGKKPGSTGPIEFGANNSELPLNNNSNNINQLRPQNLSFINNGHIINNQTSPIPTTQPSNFHVNMNITNININQKNPTLINKSTNKCEKDHIVRLLITNFSFLMNLWIYSKRRASFGMKNIHLITKQYHLIFKPILSLNNMILLLKNNLIK